jgi:hypothetical protein
MIVTGAAPGTGATTPGIFISVIEVIEVEGKTAVTTPELSLCVVVAPDITKLFAFTPVRVYPLLGLNAINAV